MLCLMPMPSPTSSGKLVGLPLLSLLVLAHFSNDSYANLLAPLLPTLQERFDLSETFMALFVAIIATSSNVLQPLFGAVADSFSKRLIAALGLFCCAGLMTLIGIAPSPIILFLLLVFGGLGSAAFHPAASGLSHFASSKIANKSLAFGIFVAAGPLGQAMGAVVILWIVRRFGLMATPLYMLPGLAIALAIFLFAPTINQSKRDRRFFDWNLLLGPVGLLALVGLLRSVSFITFVNATPLWLVENGVARDAALIGSSLAVYSLASSIGTVFGGWLDGVLGRRFVIVGCMLIALPLSLMMLMVPIGGAWYFISIFLGSLFINAPISPLVVSAQDLAPHAVATVSGMLMGMTWGLAGIVYIGIGVMQQYVGIVPSIWFSYLCLIPGAALAWWVLQRHVLKDS